ncbi:hypothetical protein ACFYOY_09795 [Streptomyces sp. NPDC007875]|uniref:hypothetical protein n=1 Tax=Streptomyces sp. NPDC007875 TaxID=3364783 RepID=UPI00367D17F6
MRTGSATTRLIALRGPVLDALCRDHLGRTHAYYLDVPFAETLRRHATKPQAHEYGEPEMRDWYRPLDLLPGGGETVIPVASALAETVERVMRNAGWATPPGTDCTEAQGPAAAPRPARAPRLPPGGGGR